MRLNRRPLVVLFAAMVLSLVPFAGSARAEVPPFRSLNDLPRNWSGEAGDLFNRVQASLKLGKAVEKSRIGDDRGYRAEYEVKGTFTVGSRSYSIDSAHVFVTDVTANRAEVAFHVTDPLIPTLYVAIRYRADHQDYELGEVPRDAERRYVLHASDEGRR